MWFLLMLTECMRATSFSISCNISPIYVIIDDLVLSCACSFLQSLNLSLCFIELTVEDYLSLRLKIYYSDIFWVIMLQHIRNFNTKLTSLQLVSFSHCQFFVVISVFHFWKWFCSSCHFFYFLNNNILQMLSHPM